MSDFLSTHAFDMLLELNGSEYLYFIPAGKTTSVSIESPWSTPGFDGAFLPDHREIAEDGFAAQWEVFYLNRNYPQMWNNETYRTADSSFGVNLLFPVDEYQKSMRAVKYALLFIGLTFLIFFFIEILMKHKIHIVQYLLVGFGLLLFYTLLLSLLEQVGFNLAYLLSSSAIIFTITLYSHSIFKKIRFTLIMLCSLMLLYSFLFVTLALQDYALLMGSLGLFLILGVVMFFTRKINWDRTES